VSRELQKYVGAATPIRSRKCSDAWNTMDAPDDGKHAVLDGGGKDFHFNSTYRVIRSGVSIINATIPDHSSGQ
jgi:hypothetical protein